MEKQTKIRVENLSFSYNGRSILHKTSMDFGENQITAIVGPSGSGKSTFLMTLNRLWEATPGGRLSGKIEMYIGNEFQNIYHKKQSVTNLRKRVGMVFQIPNPLPMTIYRNISFPLELNNTYDKKKTPLLVEECLKKVGLWQEVYDRLNSSALALSGGQQQRLCIARALILEPDILLLDEPTSSLDNNAASTIEKLLTELKKDCTIIMVSHYHDQVQRIADSIVKLQDGMLVKFTPSYCN